jgi:CheY-like chemotaxis protein
MQRIIKHLGYEFHVVETAAHCLSKLDIQPDIILIDLGLPDMSGYDLLMALRNMAVSRPIVAVTAHAISGERERCLEAGFDDYISKPFRFEAMVGLLAQYTNHD